VKLWLATLAVLGIAATAAAQVPALTPTSPDNETTALENDTIAHLGITANSMGTTTHTGTPAQSYAREREPGTKVPPNVLRPLGPEPPREELPLVAPAPAAVGPGPGHTLSGDFRGMGGAVNDTQSVPMDPYVGILGHKGKSTSQPPD
jgi:hypothetical protein